ncbi:MAG: hypothetical protein C0490_00570, partial [Marivirga sp.]|nr:hypothetical protein [Marivirga sp.]
MRAKISGISYSVTLIPTRYSSLGMQLKRVGVVVTWSILFSIFVNNAFAQSRLILNGAIINIAEGASLVIENSASDAITRISGHIISEGQNNNIKWNIGTTTGTYTIPWGYGDSNYIPLTFTKAAGTGTGYFLFSTYHTDWNNSGQLPTGVTNINDVSATDHSTYESDRFWQINAQSYSVKPALSNLEFTYLDTENSTPNTILESNLIAKRYNSTLNSWTDNFPGSSLNTTTNKVTVTSVDAANLQAWWILGTLNGDRYWVAPSNSNSNLSANWSASSGGTGSAGIPTPGDATFLDDGSNFICTLDNNFSAFNLTVLPEFAGTINQGSYNITVTNDATFSGGTFTGGSGSVIVNGNFSLSGSTFTAPSNALDIKGNFAASSGTFNHNNGTVLFSGTDGEQTITSAMPTTFQNITATNSSANPGIRVESNQNLKGILTLAANVNFDADGSANTSIFKLISEGDNPTLDASIAILPAGAQVSGNVTIQRFMSKEGPNSNRIYRYISSPVQNARVSDLQQEIPVTGSFTGRSSCSGCVASSQSLFAYNESIITDNDGSGGYTEHDGYVDFPDVTNTEIFQPGRGYALYVRGNILATTLWDVRGPINNGNVAPITFPVTYTSSGTVAYDGWNLVGNPFPSTIDWDAASGWTKTNMDVSIYMTDNGGPAIQTATWNGVTGTNGGSRYIAMGQGFWTKANGSGTPVLQADENTKVAGTQTTFIREGTPDNLLRITMVQGSTRDEAVVHFREDATENFDSQADALKLPNSTFNLSTLQVNGKTLAINSISPIVCKTEIKLNIENATAGSYKLKFSEHESFPDNIEMVLFDNLAGTSIDIRNNSTYDFTVSTNPASYGSSRFKILFQLPALNSEWLVSAPATCEGSDGMVQIENTQTGVNYGISSGLGSVLSSGTGNGGILTLTVPKANLNEGENQFMVHSQWKGCDVKVEQPVLITVSHKYAVTAVEAPRVCSEGLITIHAAGAPTGGSYNWYESADAIVPFADQHSDSFTTPVLSKSKTYYVSVVNELGCEGSKTSVLAEVVQVEEAQIYLSDNRDELVSNYKDNNQWYFNAEKISQATGQSISPDQSGAYGVEVTTYGCVTTASFEFMVTGVEESKEAYISIF